MHGRGWAASLSKDPGAMAAGAGEARSHPGGLLRTFVSVAALHTGSGVAPTGWQGGSALGVSAEGGQEGGDASRGRGGVRHEGLGRRWWVLSCVPGHDQLAPPPHILTDISGLGHCRNNKGPLSPWEELWCGSAAGDVRGHSPSSGTRCRAFREPTARVPHS